MHYFVGDLGHLFVITSFITALIASFAYLKATTVLDLMKQQQWRRNGMVSFFIHTLSVLGVCVTLFVIISNHYFEYHYAYNYSDRKW